MPRSEITIHVSEQNKATTDNVEYSCGACDEQDDSRMVQCDKCDHWFHYDCAGVGEDIVDKDFLCSNCQPSKGARKKRLTNVTRGVSAVTQETALENQVLTGAMPQPSAVTMVSASVTNMPALDLFPPYTMSAPQKATVTRTQIPVTKSRPPNVRLTTNQARCLAVPSGLHSTQMMQPIPTASIPTATSIVVPRETCPAQFTEILQENTQQDPVEPARSCTRVPSSKRSTKQRQLELELQLLDQERALEEQEEKKKREYLRKRYDLLREIANDNNSVASIEEDRSQTRVAEWLQGVTRTNEAQAQPDETRCRQSRDNVDWRFTSAPQQRSQIPPGPIRTTEVRGNSQLPTRSLQFGNTAGFVPVRRSTPRRTEDHDEEGHNLTHSQVAARQAVSRELPSFNGLPEEWPLFFSTFTTTTTMCGYSPEENLIRLQKCLKGKAYEAVKCRLMHPSNVPGIISTLKLLYGNPEIIIHNMIVKINSTPAPKADRLDTVVEFSLAVQNLCATIEACQLEEYSYNVALLRELVDKLPPSLKLDWARFRRTLQAVNLSTFAAWLYDLAETVCPLAMLPSCDSKASRIMKKNPAYLNAHDEQVDENSVTSEVQPRATIKACAACKGDCYSLEKCQRFKDLEYNAKWAIVKDCGLCRKCLRRHKGACKKEQICGKNGCTYKHHQLLHNDRRTLSDTSGQSFSDPVANAADHDCNLHLKNVHKVLFRVVPVVLYGPKKSLRTYAFLDDGSSLTLIDADVAKELNVEGVPEPLCLKWTGNKRRQENDSIRIDIDISGTGTNRDKHRLHGAHTVSNLDLFRQSLNVQQLTEKYNYLRGIPAESYQAIQPKILIGIDNANLSYPLKGKEGKIHEPIATKTRLGWVIHGGSDEDTVFVGHHSWNLCSCSEKIDNLLNQSVRDYFSLEGLGISKTENIVASTEDKRAIQILQSFTQTNSGHYEARLLWKYDQFRLPNSKPVALQRLRCLESRLKKDPSLSTVIREKLNEYLQKGYIRRLPEEELNEPRKRVWYLPIFPVFNPNKPSKVRIVWDAAAKTKGISLNMMLLKGPDQLTSLISVLLQFRENKVAICGDIREMFHQVFISKDDQDCQRFLWRENPSDKQPSTYIMRVMTFGASCSPSCAQYVKNQNAENHRGQYPAAVNAIIKNHYVDDMLASTETEEEAFLLAQQVHHVHAQAGFEMRNWMSNSTAVVSALQNERTDVKNLNLGSELATEKVLGMWWCTTTDMLMYKLSSKHDVELLSGKRRPTKREVLRTLMAIFDPLGLVSNLLIFLRILMQEIWRTGIQWDEEIPCHLFEKWEHWLEVLPTVSDVCIPRCYRLLTSISPETVIQLHTFVDASEAGYAAVVYLRFQQGDNVECAIVAAKSRVAPLKYVSIPRLELQAAVIGVRLANTIISSLSFKVDQRHFWTDSRNVLCWIRSDHRKYSPYVAFRVSEILETSNIGDWKYVSSKENVADEATKWSRQPELGSKSRWIKGPVWLWNSNREWPEEPPISDATREELRATVYYHCFIPKLPVDVMEFAKWRRLVRVFATVLRCVGNFRCTITGMKRTYGPLTSQELTQSSNLLIRSAQNDSFSQEIITLSGKQPNLSKSSALYKLNPFLDEHNVIRMQGRISACEYATMDARNPIILPKNHYVSKLIVQDYHERYHHRNHETVVNELRQTFWIPKLRVLFRKVRSDCQICKNLRAAPHPPLMGDLPKARLAAFTRPFSFVGADYFGPLTVVVGRRIEKRWGVLVTCLTTRAVHLEIAHTLSADSCIMALRNFMARRGKPLKIISDRGTNFTATNKELMAALKMMDQDKVLQEIISPETEWQFLPPSSPHMGGSWERLVQIVKTNLLQINQQRPLTDEILRNLLTERENLINSRPLTHVPVDNPEAPVLTPNHFILGSSSGLKPASNLNDSALVLRRSWRTSQIEANVFWRRWLRDYMPDLVRRTKWYSAVKPIEVNDIVVVVDPKLPRNCWSKGRIISVRKGNDGQVRAAIVQTQNGVYERPATKLAVLDVRRDTKVSQEIGIPGGDCCDPLVGASHCDDSRK